MWAKKCFCKRLFFLIERRVKELNFALTAVAGKDIGPNEIVRNDLRAVVSCYLVQPTQLSIKLSGYLFAKFHHSEWVNFLRMAI